MHFVKRLWRAAPLATLVLALALAAAAFFGARTVAAAIYWHDPAHREQPIAGWMPPGYVARSWHVPREVVLDAIGAPEMHKPTSLAELARRQGQPLDTLIGEIDTAIAAYRATHPGPGEAPR